jgi:hypothetical protein
MNVYGAIQRTVTYAPVHFYWSQLSDLTCPLHDESIPDRWDMSHNVHTVESHLNYVAPIWQQSCTFLSHVITFEDFYTQKSLCSVNSFAVLHLSSSVHCSVVATGMCMWLDIECPLQYLSASNALPLLNACTHFANIQYSRASSSSASHSCAWYSMHLLLFKYIHSSTLETSVSEQDYKSNKVVIKNAVCSCTYTPIWW